jgi:hypothetical protein
LFCRYLKGAALRIVYAYHAAHTRVDFIEIYFKGDKENEDQERIKNYLDIASHTHPVLTNRRILPSAKCPRGYNPTSTMGDAQIVGRIECNEIQQNKAFKTSDIANAQSDLQKG